MQVFQQSSTETSQGLKCLFANLPQCTQQYSKKPIIILGQFRFTNQKKISYKTKKRKSKKSLLVIQK